MTRSEIEAILTSCGTEKRATSGRIPEPNSWDAVEDKFACKIPDEFRLLFELTQSYWVGLDLLGPDQDPAADYGSIIEAYDEEFAANELWSRNMIPICAIGNGDYFCLLIEGSRAEKVYYVSHNDGTADLQSPTVEEWIRSLPDFLS